MEGHVHTHAGTDGKAVSDWGTFAMSFAGVLPRVRLHAGTEDKLRSAIVNCICPECGGALSVTRSQFRCQGRCGEDWRPTWNRLHAAGALVRKIRVGPAQRAARAA
jgi:hypothetical protein